MKSKEFYGESISRLQKMVKHGVYVLLFDVFAVAVQIPFILAGKWVAAHLILSIVVSFAAGFSFNTLVDSKGNLICTRQIWNCTTPKTLKRIIRNNKI